MGTPGILDLDLLLKPISENSPCGEDIRKSNNTFYYKIKNARSSARIVERQNPDNLQKTFNLWNIVFEGSIEALSVYSKDLEITAWLIEALVRKHEIAGFRDGFCLVNGLLISFWESLYPKLETVESDRLFAFTGLNGEERAGALIAPLYRVHITQGKTLGPFALWNYIQAIELEKITDLQKREDKIKGGAITILELENAAKETPKDFFLQLSEDIQDALKEFKCFENLLDEKCKENAPPTSMIRTTLEKAQEGVNFLYKDLLDQAAGENNDIGGFVASEGAALPETFEGSHLLSREAAFKSLLEIARFFKRTEPHSPLPYILERAVRWGQLSLPDLLSELVDDESARKRFFQLTGIETNN